MQKAQVLFDGDKLEREQRCQRFLGIHGATMALKDRRWFTDNVKTWLWFNSDDSADEEDFVVEDILEHYGLRGTGE